MLAGIVGVDILDRTHYILTDKDRTLSCICAPPMDENRVVCYGMTYLPINLRDVVVNPTLTHPFEHVGIEVVVVLSAVCGTASWVVTLVAIDAEGTDAKLHPRLYLANLLAHLLHELVDILTTPIAFVHAASICVVGCVVGNGNARNGVGVEVVVHMDAIHVIAPDDITYDLADEVAILGTTRVEEEQAVVVEEAVGMTRIFVC